MTQNNDEKRLNRRLIALWHELRGDRPVPEESDLHPEELGLMWQHCYMIQVKNNEDGHLFKYNFLGEEIIKAYGGDNPVGKDICDTLIDTNGDDTYSMLESVIDSGAPLLQESEFVNQLGVQIRYRRCFLPFSTKNGTIKYIFGGMRWKAV